MFVTFPIQPNRNVSMRMRVHVFVCVCDFFFVIDGEDIEEAIMRPSK